MGSDLLMRRKDIEIKSSQVRLRAVLKQKKNTGQAITFSLDSALASGNIPEKCSTFKCVKNLSKVLRMRLKVVHSW